MTDESVNSESLTSIFSYNFLRLKMFPKSRKLQLRGSKIQNVSAGMLGDKKKHSQFAYDSQ